MAKKKLRVLYARFGKVADDVIIVDAATAETCVDSGWCDGAPAAVKFALSLGKDAEVFELPSNALVAADDAISEEGAADDAVSEEGAAADDAGAPSDAAE